MKAPNFRYIKPRSLEHAYRILEANGADAVPLAGGQSLLAGLAMRLFSPRLVVDIGDLEELAQSSHDDDEIRLGALTRHCELLRSDLIQRRLPLLAKAAPHIGHWAIRNRGTLGGSLAYADPAAELPACCVALGATLVLGSSRGERHVAAETFFRGLFETDLQMGELLLAVRFPAPAVPPVTGFAELARRHGDFAVAGLAAVARLRHERIESARLAYFGCVDRAKIAHNVSAAVAGCRLPLSNGVDFDTVVADDVQPDDSPGWRGSTKLHLAQVLTRRVLNQLSSEAADGHP